MLNVRGNMTDVKSIIQRLKELDYSTNPYKETRNLISGLGNFGFIQLTLHATNEFIRARPLKNEETVCVVKDLSYKPQNCNKTYQRASTPNKTMFYAALVQPEFTPDGFLAMGRLIGLMESLPFMRDKTSKGIEKLAFGKWTNTKDLNLAAIVYNEQFSKKNPKTEFLYKAFNQHAKNIGNLYEKSLIVTDFLATEFAKDNIHNHFDYMISSIFSEISVEKGFDGILYPSVRTIGQGLNVAIHPDFVDNYMELRSAGECTVFKNKEQINVLNDTVTIIPRGQNELKLKPFDEPAKLDRERQNLIKLLGL